VALIEKHVNSSFVDSLGKLGSIDNADIEGQGAQIDFGFFQGNSG
jgi:hypothetical protein